MDLEPDVLLQKLIAIPSVNPMGRDVSGPEFYETRLTEYLCGMMDEAGILYEVQEVHPGRSNVIARLEGSPGAPTVLLDVHQDTVPVDGMTIPPFDPQVRDGKIYGRGASDVKGGMASMLSAFLKLNRDRPDGMATTILSLTCDEEATATGVAALADLWNMPNNGSQVLPSPPDVAVVAEPTMLDIVVAHRGATRFKLRTAGRACHSSRPQDGISAIYRMARVVMLLEEYAGKLADFFEPHPLCGPPTLSVGRIEGGSSINVVPDWCQIEVDRRVIPGENHQTVLEHLTNYLTERLDFEIEIQPPYLNGPPLPDDNNGPLAEALMSQIEAVAGPHAKVGVPYGTHASRTALGGVPSVVFGPGDIAQAHTKDEWIEIEQLKLAADVYYRFCASGGAR